MGQALDARAVAKQPVPPNAMGGKATHHKGKGSQLEILPHRGALSQLVRSPQKTVNDYAKATPDVVQSGPSVNDMERGP